MTIMLNLISEPSLLIHQVVHCHPQVITKRTYKILDHHLNMVLILIKTKEINLFNQFNQLLHLLLWVISCMANSESPRLFRIVEMSPIPITGVTTLFRQEISLL